MNFIANKNKTIHFIGILGIGMSSLAKFLHNLGFNVQGSDSGKYSADSLEKINIKVFKDHNESNLANADIVIISSAIKDDNVEYATAKNRNLPIFKRGKILGDISRFYKYSIAVAGTHGKTTTTSLISHLLIDAMAEPTAIVGGIVNSWDDNVKIGKNTDFFISEADESDNTFLNFNPFISIVTNIESEHLSFHKTEENLKNNFINFISNTLFCGYSIVCGEDEGVKSIMPLVNSKNVITYGIDEGDFSTRNIIFDEEGTSFDIVNKIDNITIKDVKIPLYGRHNILNSLTTAIIANIFDVKAEVLKKSLLTFEGVKRRFTKIGTLKNNIRFIDDYAHHPSEIKAVLTAADKIKNSGSVIAVVQPHRYSRLKDYFDDFITSFDLADNLILLNVYAAGEGEIKGFTSKDLYNALKEKGFKNIKLVEDNTKLTEAIAEIIKDNDIVIFMGAGDITNIAQETLKQTKVLRD